MRHWSDRSGSFSVHPAHGDRPGIYVQLCTVTLHVKYTFSTFAALLGSAAQGRLTRIYTRFSKERKTKLFPASVDLSGHIWESHYTRLAPPTSPTPSPIENRNQDVAGANNSLFPSLTKPSSILWSLQPAIKGWPVSPQILSKSTCIWGHKRQSK